MNACRACGAISDWRLLEDCGAAEADTGFTPRQRVVCWKAQTAQEGGCWPDPGVESSKERLSSIYHVGNYLSVRRHTYGGMLAERYGLDHWRLDSLENLN